MNRALRRAAVALCALAAPLALAAPAAAATRSPLGPGGKPIATAGIEHCVTSVNQLQRSVAFVGEMTVIPGTVRMQMRIELLERGPLDLRYRAIAYPGLGQALRSSAGVKTYRNLSKVTNLSAPASYRAQIRFRWLASKGRLLRTLELRTPRCMQPAALADGARAAATAGASAATAG